MLVIFFFVLDWLVKVYSALLLARALLSWFPLPPSLSGLYELLTVLTEPLLKPVRKLLWRIPAMNSIPVDISPVVLLVLLNFVKSLLYLIFSLIV